MSSTADDTAARLAAIWADVLGIPHVEREDNFFDLGGESISGMLCINRVRSVFGVTIPLSTLMTEHMTLGLFANVVGEARQATGVAVSG